MYTMRSILNLYNRMCLVYHGGFNSIFDPQHLIQTANRLEDFLIKFFRMERTGVARDPQMVQILENIAPYYEKVRYIQLGQNKVASITADLGHIYEGLNGITNRVTYRKGENSSITGKSKALLSVWGQTPGFDSTVRIKLCSNFYPPPPDTLSYLKKNKIYYSSDEFCVMIEELDKWVYEWPKTNKGRAFASLDTKLPIGRLIDMIYVH